MEKIKVFMNQKIVRIFGKTLKFAVYAILVLFILVVSLQRFTSNKISFFNYRMFSVITGSMVPVYNVGDVLIAKETKPSDIKIGDDVTYLGRANDFKDKVVTHRVIGIDQAGGKLYFHTQGVANLVEDPIVAEDQLYGVVIHKTWILSLIYKTIASPLGFFMFIIIPLMFVIGSEMISTLLEKEAERREKLAKRIKK